MWDVLNIYPANRVNRNVGHHNPTGRKRGMATDANDRVIALLAKEWDMKGPPGIMDISDIVAALPLAPSDTLAALKELHADGLIDMNKLKTSVFLTPEGYDAAERGRGAGRP